MAENSRISWTSHTANFWWGCFKLSTGCTNCYASTLSHRYGKTIWGPPATTSREYKKGIWKELPKWDKQSSQDGVRRRVFVSSMADFFEEHPQVIEWRRDALKLMLNCENLDFQVLTKRPENIMRFIEAAGESLLKNAGYKEGKRLLTWVKHGTDFAPVNFWLGTSVENQEQANIRIPHLLQVPAAVRFLSCEPLLGAVNLDKWFGLIPGECLCGEIDVVDRPCLTCESRFASGQESGINWVITGSESGHGARPMDLDWVRSLRDQCQAAGVPFFFKQMIADGKKVELPELDGKVWAEMPVMERA